MESIAQQRIRVYDTLKSHRASLEAYWQDLTKYSIPRKAYITKLKNLGDKLPTDIYDSTALLSLAYFAAGMQAYMSSPQSKWFYIGSKNKNLMQKKNVAQYFRDVEDVLYAMINSSNFYQEDVESYLSLGSIGTDVLYGEEDLEDDVRFDSLPIESVVVDWDDTKRVRVAYLEYEFSAMQAFQKFGGKISAKALECIRKADHVSKFKYLFCVYPREIYDASKKDSKNMPFAAIWIDKQEKKVVKEGGYKKFPFFVSRFAKDRLSPYGYSPQMNVQPDIKMINAMEKNNILSAQNAVRPPLEIPDEAFLKPYNFNPGGKNIKNAGFPNEHIVPINTGSNVILGIDYINIKKQAIQQAFYNDLFVSMDQIGKMTATEVQIRNNQRMQLLGSAIGNIMREKLSPVVEFCYNKAFELGKLPEAPRELVGQEYEIEYISPLAKAQQSLELQNVNQALEIIAGFGTVDPSVFDKIDFDKAVDYVGEITNIKPKIIRDDAEVEAIRTGRQQAEMTQAQMGLMQQGVDITKSASEADKNLAEVGAK